MELPYSEPYKIKMVETIKRSTKEQRLKWIKQANYNLFNLASEKVFIDLYTNWCGWCKRMDATTFSNQEIANYLNQNFYAVKLDAETKKSILFKGSVFKKRHIFSHASL